MPQMRITAHKLLQKFAEVEDKAVETAIQSRSGATRDLGGIKYTVNWNVSNSMEITNHRPKIFSEHRKKRT